MSRDELPQDGKRLVGLGDLHSVDFEEFERIDFLLKKVSHRCDASCIELATYLVGRTLLQSSYDTVDRRSLSRSRHTSDI
jgi:hypothetical protein